MRSYVWVTVNGEDWGLYLAGRGAGGGPLPGEISAMTTEDCISRIINGWMQRMPMWLLKYIDDDPESYPNIFDNAKVDITQGDKERVIEALKILSTGKDLEKAGEHRGSAQVLYRTGFCDELGTAILDIQGIIIYLLDEEEGILSILPWGL